MSLPRVVVVGGHGKVRVQRRRSSPPAPADTSLQVALHFAHLASASHAVTSLVRSRDQFQDITATGASPQLLSLEDASVSELSAAFAGARSVVFSAGAGGKGGAERTKAVDFDGAVKVRSGGRVGAVWGGSADT